MNPYPPAAMSCCLTGQRSTGQRSSSSLRPPGTERTETPMPTNSSPQIPSPGGTAGSLSFSVSHPQVCSRPERLAVLRRVRIFRDLDDGALSELDGLMTTVSSPAEVLLCREGVPASSMNLHEAGRAHSFTVVVEV